MSDDTVKTQVEPDEAYMDDAMQEQKYLHELGDVVDGGQLGGDAVSHQFRCKNNLQT